MRRMSKLGFIVLVRRRPKPPPALVGDSGGSVLKIYEFGCFVIQHSGEEKKLSFRVVADASHPSDS
jgi:hypothetical protein